MKKITFLLMVAAISLNLSAVEFPSSWVIDGFNWCENVKAEGLTQKTAKAGFLKDVYEANPESSKYDNKYDFDSVWEDYLGEGYECLLNSYVPMGNAPKVAKPNDHQYAGIKVGYDNDALYVFLKYQDTEMPNGKEVMEVCVSPYDKLEKTNNIIAAGVDFTETAVYFRYIDLGAFKVTANKSRLDIMTITNTGTGNDVQDATIKPEPTGAVLFDHTSTQEAQILKWVVKIPLRAMTGFEDMDDFNLSAWDIANGKKGISFDVKFRELDNGDLDGDCRDYWWNSNDNAGFYSTSYSGYLRPGGKVSAEETAISNLSIVGDIISAEGNIQIYNSVGLLVKSGAAEVSINGLAAGTYIAVSAGQSLKFQVK